MQLLVTHPIVIAPGRYAKPGEIHEVADNDGRRIISVERGIETKGLKPEEIAAKQKELKAAHAKAEAELDKAGEK
jgi:hypothetical protein